MSQPWEKRAEERGIEYEVFYRWLTNKPRKTDRDFEKAFPEYGVTYRTINRWRNKHEWHARAEAFDAHFAAVEVKAREEQAAAHGQQDELDAFRDRLMKSAQLMNQLGHALTAKVIRDLAALGNDPIPSSLATAARAAGTITQNSLNAEAAVLGVDDIIGALGRSAARSDDEE